MTKFNELSGAIRFALLASSLSLVAMPVMAQDEDEDVDVLTAVQVTGSRIQSQTVTAASPVTEVSREDFEFAGTTRVEDLLNTFPQLAPSFDSFTVNPTTGFATADLRGLGTNRTLVLVNGQRMQPGGIRSQAVDLNQIPAALVQRVDVLTGGASAVYGSDAVAGVVNFILDTEFEGFTATAGYSAYQHDNDNSYIRGNADGSGGARLLARGFDFPDGDSGFDGEAKHLDLAIGGRFADNAGHAMAWFTYRKNNELRQEARDYSSCALSANGRTCGGSSTAPNPNFLVFSPSFGGFANINPATGGWRPGVGELYNFAPINHYQRPDERYTFGGSIKYEVSPYFRPYIESMFTNTNTRVQIAESGTFFVNLLQLGCDDPLVGSLCTDLGLPLDEPLDIYVGKRNVEGGPRVSAIESNSFRVVTGFDGDLNESWYYNVSALYGRNSSNEANINDFLPSRVGDALLGCPAGSFDGCIPYNVWVPGGVTAEAAAALSDTGIRNGATELRILNAYMSGDLGFGFASANEDPITLVVGAEYRTNTYTVESDANMATGNFTGLGGPRPSITGEIKVRELFMESIIPVIADAGALSAFNIDLGYRYSDYDRAGSTNTYKIGAIADFGNFRVRGGYNRAIRAPNVGEIFADQQLSLFGGDDPCAGDNPQFTQAQCANTGVSAAQYGNILGSPADQYNQFTGGNLNLKPEEADTYTLGLVVTPIERLQLSLDYYDIEITDVITGIGAQTILNFCGTTGDPFLCSKINRRPGSGDLWVGSDPNTSGFVENLTSNFGELRARGIDLTAAYSMDVFGGVLSASFVGTRFLELETAPLPGINDDATYDCVGLINTSCQQPDWRHTASLRFSRDFYTTQLRWRHVGGMDYEEITGEPGTTDLILVDNGNQLGSYNYIDLSGSFDITPTINWTIGVNNIFDKEPPMVGGTLTLNANAPGGYDQLGRFVFTNVTFTY